MKKIKGYVSLEEIRKDLLLLDSAQDRFIVMAIYNGIAGKNNMSELLNLKTSDLDLNKKTITLDDRVVKMDSIFLKEAKEVLEQKILFADVRNGEGKTKEEIELNMNSPYVIKVRPRVINKNGLEPMKYSGFRTRFATIKEKCGLDVNASELETSGIINKLLDEKKEWTVLDIEFDLRKKNIKANAYRIYSIIKEIND